MFLVILGYYEVLNTLLYLGLGLYLIRYYKRSYV